MNRNCGMAKGRITRILHKSLGLFLFSGLYLLGSAGLAHAQKVATLDKVQGEVRVFKEGKTRGLKGRNGMALFARSRVRTMSGARADVVYNSGDRVRMMPNSEMVLTSAAFSQGKSNVRIRLAAGKIFNVVNKLVQGASYEVTARTATAGVKGTVFSAETSAARDVFMVKQGAVEAVSPGVAPKTVLVTDLKKTIVRAGQAPNDPVDMTPEEIAMFDVLDDVLTEIKENIQEEIRETIKEDIINDLMERDLGD